MFYKFICPKCGEHVELQIPISQYKSDGHFCKCGTELQRDPSDFCTNSKRNIDGFFGTSSKS